jgi:hypothetical protein
MSSDETERRQAVQDMLDFAAKYDFTLGWLGQGVRIRDLIR